MIPELSPNGRWRLGMIYVPADGPHGGHKVEVVNPAADVMVTVPMHKDGQLVEEKVHAIAVYVRCQDCLLSWFFSDNQTATGVT